MRKLLWMAVFLVLAGCSAAKSASLRMLPEVVAAQSQARHDLLLPSYIPEAFSFTGIRVETPPIGDLRPVEITFKGPQGDVPVGGLLIRQWPGKGEIGGDNVEPVQVGDDPGQYQELKRPDATVRSLQFVCGGVSVLLVTTELSREELFRVAESLSATKTD